MLLYHRKLKRVIKQKHKYMQRLSKKGSSKSCSLINCTFCLIGCHKDVVLSGLWWKVYHRAGFCLGMFSLALYLRHRRFIILGNMGCVITFGTVRLLGAWSAHSCFCHFSFLLLILCLCPYMIFVSYSMLRHHSNYQGN